MCIKYNCYKRCNNSKILYPCIINPLLPNDYLVSLVTIFTNFKIISPFRLPLFDHIQRLLSSPSHLSISGLETWIIQEDNTHVREHIVLLSYITLCTIFWAILCESVASSSHILITMTSLDGILWSYSCPWIFSAGEISSVIDSALFQRRQLICRGMTPKGLKQKL